MPSVQEHAVKSLDRINQKNPQMLKENWDVIRQMVWEIHYWFDYYYRSPGYETPGTLFYHRELRHHNEGITQAVTLFSKKYAHKFKQIIQETAADHVLDDFGEIPSREECDRRYLRAKRGW